MNIAVCMKQVSYVYAKTGRDPETNFISALDVVHLNNPPDEVALEQAVRIRAQLGTGEVWAFSLGERLIESEARRALAIGADHFVYLHDFSWGETDAWSTATLLGKAIKKVSADLVLCGTFSMDLGRGEVGQYIASQLSFPFIGNVVRLTFTGNDISYIIERALGKGDRQEIKVKPPFVLGVGQALCEVKHPSRAALLQAREKTILQWDGKALEVESGDLQPRVYLGPVVTPRPRTKRIPLLEGSLPGDKRMEWLLFGDSGRKKGAIQEGDPVDLAESLLKFLRDNGLLKTHEAEEQGEK